MCRWLAYSGAPLFLEELIFKPKHSLIDQSLSSNDDDIATNGDGFGIGWYGKRPYPGVYRETQPAWNDDNLRDLAAQIESPLFLAHVRAATGAAVQQTNCHPFRHGQWLFVHNGSIQDFRSLRRELTLAVAPELFPYIVGATESGIMFFLALTFGMQEDVVGGIERMVGFIEDVAGKHGIQNPLQMTLGISDGRRIYAFRYSSEGKSRTLFHSRSKEAIQELHPDVGELPDELRIVVSEPFSDLTDLWVEIPESSVLIVEHGELSPQPFAPQRSHQPA
ncbi:MAG: class II glutamine amidotransferase [Thermoanaerobaculia bacterium]